MAIADTPSPSPPRPQPRYGSWLVAALLLWVAAPLSGSQGPHTLRAEDPRLEQGIDLIYNLKFAEADAHFKAIVDAEPDNPVGYFFLAMVTWWRVLVDLDDRSHDEAFYQLLDRCIKVCDRRLKKDPEDFDAVLCKGGAIGFRGRLRGNRGQYVRAARDGLRGVRFLKHIRRLEPTNKDILFGQGIYDYFADVVPKRFPVVRPILWLMPDGDRQKGLEELEMVFSQGHYAQAEAGYFLAQIYHLFEEDTHRALGYTQTLLQRYPDNALFASRTARLQIKRGQWRQGIALYRDYIRRARAGDTGFHRRGQVEAHYYLGHFDFTRDRLLPALAAFTAADSLAAPFKEKRMRQYAALANLQAGKIHDLTGQRQKAIAAYKRVKKLPDVSKSHNRAKQYLKTPYTP